MNSLQTTETNRSVSVKHNLIREGHDVPLRGQCPHQRLAGSTRKQKDNSKCKFFGSCFSRPCRQRRQSSQENKVPQEKANSHPGLAVSKKAPPTAKSKEKPWTFLRRAQLTRPMASQAAPHNPLLPAHVTHSCLGSLLRPGPQTQLLSPQIPGASASGGSALPGDVPVVQRDSGTVMDTRTWAPLAAGQGSFVDKHTLQGTFHSVPLAAFLLNPPVL